MEKEPHFEDFDLSNIIYTEDNVLVLATPLFKFLGISDKARVALTNTMKNPDETRKHLMPTPNGSRYMTVLTNSGIRVLFSSNQASKIPNRLYLKSKFDELYDSYIASKLQAVKNPLDLDLKPGPVIYLIHIKDNLYKFGETDDIKRRLYEHSRSFDYNKVINIFRCLHKTATQEIERRIKELLKAHNCLVEYPQKNNPQKVHVEVFKYDEDIAIVVDKFENIVLQYNIEASRNADDYNDFAYKIQQNKTLELSAINIQMDQKISLAKYNAMSETNEMLQIVIKNLQNDINNLRREFQEFKDEMRFKKADRESSPVETIVVKQSFNKPGICNIDMDELMIFVKRSFKLCPDGKFGKKKLYGHLETTKYKEFTFDIKSKQEFNLALYSCLESAFKIDARKSPDGRIDGDNFYGYEFVYTPIEDFISECCTLSDNANESIDNVKEAYEIYCMEKNSFGFDHQSEFPNEMKRIGYKFTTNGSGHRRYHGFYLKKNHITDFIMNCCEVGDDTVYCSYSSFEESYKKYSVEKGALVHTLYNRKAILCIIRDTGIKTHSFNNGCINIVGLTITGKVYNRNKKHLPIPTMVPDEEPADNIAND